MPYFKDLREFLADVERRGRLHTFSNPVNKETELMPLFRVQMRGLPEEQRKVLQFEDVKGIDGQSFPMRVAAGVYGASSDFVAWGMGCESIREAMEKWHQGIARQLNFHREALDQEELLHLDGGY